MCDSLRPHRLHHTRPPCPSLSPGVCSNSCPLMLLCKMDMCHYILVKNHKMCNIRSESWCKLRILDDDRSSVGTKVQLWGCRLMVGGVCGACESQGIYSVFAWFHCESKTALKNKDYVYIVKRKYSTRTSLVVQKLSPHLYIRGMGSIPSQGTKISHVARCGK